MNVTITVNGKRIQADVPAGQTLLQFLREQGYRSVKCGCETTNCGLCSVWMDEKTVLSCSVPVGRADGHRITTLEGLGQMRKSSTGWQGIFVAVPAIWDSFVPSEPGF